MMIKTDEELRIERRSLIEDRRKLKCIQQGMIDDMDNLKQAWRETKDPIVKRNIHREIFRLNDEIMFGIVTRSIETLNYSINSIDRMLYSKPSPTYGCIYDTYQNLNYDDLLRYGVIHGVKL